MHNLNRARYFQTYLVYAVLFFNVEERLFFNNKEEISVIGSWWYTDHSCLMSGVQKDLTKGTQNGWKHLDIRVLYVSSFNEGKRMSPLQKTASCYKKGARSHSENAPLELTMHFNLNYCCCLALNFFVLRPSSAT